MQLTEQVLNQVVNTQDQYIDYILNHLDIIVEIRKQINNQLQIVDNIETTLVQQEKCYLKSIGLMEQIQYNVYKDIQSVKSKSTTNLKLQEIMQTFDVPESLLQKLKQEEVNYSLVQAIEQTLPILNSDNFDNLRIKYQKNMKNDKVGKFFQIIFGLAERLQDYIYQQDTQIFQRNNKIIFEFVSKVNPEMKQCILQLYEQYVGLQNYNFTDDIENLIQGYCFRPPYHVERQRGRTQEFCLFMPALNDAVIQTQFLFFKKINNAQNNPYSFEKEIRAQIDTSVFCGIPRQDLKYDDPTQVYLNQILFQYNFHDRQSFDKVQNVTMLELYNTIQKQKYHSVKQGVKIQQSFYNTVYFPEHIIYFLIKQVQVHITKQQQWQKECLPFEYNNTQHLIESLQKCIQKLLHHCDFPGYVNLFCTLKEELSHCDIEDLLHLIDRILNAVSYGILLEYYYIFGYLVNNPILESLLDTFEQKLSFIDGYLKQSKIFKQNDSKSKLLTHFDGSLIDPGSNSSVIVGSRVAALVLTLKQLQNSSLNNILTMFIQDFHQYIIAQQQNILEQVNIKNDKEKVYDLAEYIKEIPQSEHHRLYVWIQEEETSEKQQQKYEQ